MKYEYFINFYQIPLLMTIKFMVKQCITDHSKKRKETMHNRPFKLLPLLKP